MKRIMLILLAACLVIFVPSATAQQSEREFLYNLNSRNLLLLRSVINEKNDLTPSEVFDYIAATTKIAESGIEELSEIDENTIMKELKLKQESIELIKLILEKEGSK